MNRELTRREKILLLVLIVVLLVKPDGLLGKHVSEKV